MDMVGYRQNLESQGLTGKILRNEELAVDLGCRAGDESAERAYGQFPKFGSIHFSQ